MSESISNEQIIPPGYNIDLFTDLPTIHGSVTKLTITPSSEPAQAARESSLRGYMGHIMRVTLTDGRIYEGTFWAYDNEGTILMRNGRRVLSEDEPPKMGEGQHEFTLLHVQQQHIQKVVVTPSPVVVAASASAEGSEAITTAAAVATK